MHTSTQIGMTAVHTRANERKNKHAHHSDASHSHLNDTTLQALTLVAQESLFIYFTLHVLQ
jgi:hypothetical protein